MSKIKTIVRYAKSIASKAKKKGKPLARKIISESIKIERMMESEAKKIVNKRATKKSKRKR